MNDMDAMRGSPTVIVVAYRGDSAIQLHGFPDGSMGVTVSGLSMGCWEPDECAACAERFLSLAKIPIRMHAEQAVPCATRSTSRPTGLDSRRAMISNKTMNDQAEAFKDATPEGLKSPSSSAVLRPGTRGRILVVEDHCDSLRVTTRLLVSAGYAVSGASTAEAALELLKTESFDVVVSDIGLSGTDGHQLMREIRRRRGTTPGIALSGYAMADDVKKSIAAGFVAHLAKPIEFQQLYRAIEDVITRR